MVGFNPTISIITWNVNDFKIPIKNELSEWILKNKTLFYTVSKKSTTLNVNTQI